MSRSYQLLRNVNKIKLSELTTFFSQELDKLGDEDVEFRKKQYVTHIENYSQHLDQCSSLPYWPLLLDLEDSFNSHFEQFMKPLDRAMNISTERMVDTLNELNMGVTEALKLLPDYTTACTLMPQQEEGGSSINFCEGNTYGEVWPPKELRVLMEWLRNSKSQEAISYFSLESEYEQLSYYFQKVDEIASQFGLSEALYTLREKRYHLVQIYPLIIMDLYPDLEITEPPRIVDPSEISNKVYFMRYMGNTMSDFSCNDFSHDVFIRIVENIYSQLAELRKVDKGTKKEFANAVQQYREIIATFTQREWWKTYNKHEAIWSRAVEQVLLRIKFSIETYDTADKERCYAHQNSDSYKAATKLWETLPPGPFDVLCFISRGKPINMRQWEVMRTEFYEPENILRLSLIGADRKFSEAYEADNLLVDIISQNSLEDLFMHQNLREIRSTLTGHVNLINGYTKSDL